MSSFLHGNAKIVHVSKLPEAATRENAVAMLHDHVYLMHCDPHMTKYELLDKPPPPLKTKGSAAVASASAAAEGGGELPESVQPLHGTESYSVTDVIHTLPAGLWDSNVVSTYQFTDTKEGLFVRIRSPLSVVMDTVWMIREVAGDDGGEAGQVDGDAEGKGKGKAVRLELVEDVTINCPRVLLGVVKGQCEGAWANIHAKMISKLV